MIPGWTDLGVGITFWTKKSVPSHMAFHNRSRVYLDSRERQESASVPFVHYKAKANSAHQQNFTPWFTIKLVSTASTKVKNLFVTRRVRQTTLFSSTFVCNRNYRQKLNRHKHWWRDSTDSDVWKLSFHSKAWSSSFFLSIHLQQFILLTSTKAFLQKSEQSEEAVR